jgi:hypothetical protein
MVSIPVLTIFLALVAMYLAMRLAYHIRDIHEDRANQNDGGRESAPRHGGAHQIHL